MKTQLDWAEFSISHYSPKSYSSCCETKFRYTSTHSCRNHSDHSITVSIILFFFWRAHRSRVTVVTPCSLPVTKILDFLLLSRIGAHSFHASVIRVFESSVTSVGITIPINNYWMRFIQNNRGRGSGYRPKPEADNLYRDLDYSGYHKN